MKLFWICWGIDLFVAVIGLFFFLDGISTATPGSNFYKTWAVLFLVLGGILGGSLILKNKGLLVPALVLAALPALLAVLYGLFILMIIILKPRWN